MVAVALPAGGSALPPGERPPTTAYVKFLAFMAVIGGFLFGYDTGVTSAALLYFPTTLQMDYTWKQLVVAITVGFCGIFALLAGWANDRFGRKPVIIAASGMFWVGSALLAGSLTKEMLLVGRMIIGAAVGFASMTVPAYVAEAAPPHLRGVMVTCFQLMITLGILLSSILGGAFSYVNPFVVGWRLMFGVAAIPGLIQFIGFFFLPESPRWLATHGKRREAKRVLRKIYGVSCKSKLIRQEMADIEEGQRRMEEEKKAMGGGSVLMNMWRVKHVRKALFVGCSVQLFQQLAGVNTLMYYTASVVKMSGIQDPQKAIWMTCLVTGVNFCFTFVPIFLVERLGRRKLLLMSQIGVILSLVFLGGSFAGINKTAPILNATLTSHIPNKYSSDFAACSKITNCDDCVTRESCGACIPSVKYSKSIAGYCLPSPLGQEDVSEVGPCMAHSNSSMIFASDYCPTPFPFLPILGMVLYLSVFSCGMAPMPWVINSEIYPFWARSTGVAIATSCNWFANLLISFTFLYLTELMTKYGTFFLYAGITIGSFFLFIFIVPETKGMPIEKVEELFGAPPRDAPPLDMKMKTLQQDRLNDSEEEEPLEVPQKY